MDRFDWQTEEEGPLAPTIDPAPRRRRRSWIAPAIVVSLIGLAIVVFWQLERRAEIRDQAVNDDVLAAFSIWRQAVVRKDADLLGTLLMGGDAEWTATQKRLLLADRFLDRDEMGLVLGQKGSLALDVDPTIDVAENWRSAEISFPLTYLPTNGDPAGSVVLLEQTLPLSREGSRWLLKRPDEAFWGIWRASAGHQATITYRARDEKLAERFLADLEKDLKRVCASSGAETECPAENSVAVRLESDPQVLFKLSNREAPAFIGRTFLLPSPTLVGMPLDESGYKALYHAYAEPILETYAAMLAAPIQLPEQNVSMLCFSRYGDVPRLYSYDPAGDIWHSELNGRAFRFLAANEADSTVILREFMPGEPNRLRLVQWSGDQTPLRHDATYDPLTDHQVGWAGLAAQPSLLLGSYRGTMRHASYNLIDTDSLDVTDCPTSGCGWLRLDGFPVWSPTAEHSLVLIEGQVSRAGGDGRAIAPLGEGYSPFWLDNQRYGFVRPVADGDRQTIELVTGAVGEDALVTLWRTDSLKEALTEADSVSPVFIQHVEVIGGEPQRILMYGRQYAGPNSQYIFFSLPILPADESSAGGPIAGPVRIELVLDSRPAGLPSADDPNGHVPFVTSPDGQWLTVGNLDEKGLNQWTIHVSQINGDGAFHFSTNYPGYSFSHPFFDWSSDGRWLLIVDEDFIRLVAPTLEFERIIAHDQRACSYPAWVNWPSMQ